MIRVPLTLQHLRDINVQESQKDAFDFDYAAEFYLAGPGFALLDGDEPFALFLLHPVDDYGRYIAFTVFAEDLGTRRLLFAAREARSWLNEWGDYRRCEAYCLEDAVDEIHWCRYVLQMELEGKLQSFMPDGRAAYIFARVNDGH